MKIKITVPQKNEHWKVSFGRGERKRSSAVAIFRAVERHLQARALREKMEIVVKYGKDISNETIASQDTKYLLYALSCFLEDYLPAQTLSRVEKTFTKGETNGL